MGHAPMDIQTIDDVAREDEGTLVMVKDAAGEEQDGVTILVAGTYSTAYRKAVSAQRDRMLRQRRGNLTGEQLERQQLELVAACIIEWDGFTSNGQPFPLSKDNAITLLTRAPWIREQVEEAMSDHASYFTKPAAS